MIECFNYIEWFIAKNEFFWWDFLNVMLLNAEKWE